MKGDFTQLLMQWNRRANTRQMPWKGEKDPYKIWISEIILQQTRVEQGLEYYRRFIEAFPTVQQLARAPDQKVFKLWEGLGYYTRCKNLITTARYIAKERKGKFPDTYEDILALKGIGPYTAAAISSFAFQLPHAVVDGNVFRVLSRYFGVSTPIDSTDGKKLYTQIANSLLEKKSPGAYNQAIMDFGAVVCKPQQPLCAICPLKQDCQAFQHGWTNQLPIKEKQLQRKTRWLYYFIVSTDKKILIRKRSSKDIWQNLYEFVLYESSEQLTLDKTTLGKLITQLFGKSRVVVEGISDEFSQQLTHQSLNGRFIHLEMAAGQPLPEGYEAIKLSAIGKYPFPRFITAYLQRPVKTLQLF
jgi:A/G-specific adenine glycosylase